MKYYEYSGRDSGSDSGNWRVIIRASNEKLARKYLIQHLINNRRPELATEKDTKPLNIRAGDDPIVFSELEGADEE